VLHIVPVLVHHAVLLPGVGRLRPEIQSSRVYNLVYKHIPPTTLRKVAIQYFSCQGTPIFKYFSQALTSFVPHSCISLIHHYSLILSLPIFLSDPPPRFTLSISCVFPQMSLVDTLLTPCTMLYSMLRNGLTQCPRIWSILHRARNRPFKMDSSGSGSD
jgi:hypothetical protein